MFRFESDALPATLAAAVPSDASRPVRGLERTMLELGGEMGPDLIVVRVDGPADAGAIRAGVEAARARHPILRAAAIREGDGWRFEVRSPEENPLPFEIIDRIGDDPAADPARPLWQRVAERETARPFDPADGMMRAAWIAGTPAEGPGGWLMISAHHAIVDGTSLMRVVHDALTAAAAIQGGGAADLPLRPLTPAAVTRFPGTRWVGWLRPALRRWWAREVAAYQGAPTLAPARPLADGERIRSVCAFRRGERAGWSGLKAACEAAGVTVGAALLAATHLAVARRAADPGAERVLVPLDVEVNLRTRAVPPASSEDVGFYTGGVRAAVEVPRHIPFWNLARALSDRAQEQIALGVPAAVHWLADGGEVLGSLREAGVDPRAAAGTAAPVNVSNVGRYPYPEAYGPLRLSAIYGLNGACPTGPAVIVWLRFLGGRLFYNAVGSSPAIPRETLEGILADIQTLLEQGDKDDLTLAAWLR